MTKLQKAFETWLRDVQSIVVNNGGIPNERHSYKWVVPTRFGDLLITIHDSDYDSQKKQGFVSIYMKFDVKDLSTIEKAIWGDFNHFSGKWNIHSSGDKKDIHLTRQLALDELERRLLFCRKVEKDIDSVPKI
jgi:hypothetical protein